MSAGPPPENGQVMSSGPPPENGQVMSSGPPAVKRTRDERWSACSKTDT